MTQLRFWEVTSVDTPREPMQKMVEAFKAKVPADHERESGKGRKDDKEKQRWDLIPWASLAEVVAALTYGARKYADNNWKKVPSAKGRYTGAAFRHLTAWAHGEQRDPETGIHHLGHAGCCLLFLMWFDLTNTPDPE